MTSDDGKRQWLRDYYARVDAMDSDGFLSMIAEDATLLLANADPVVGREDIAAAFGGLLGVVRSTRHVLHTIHDLGGDLAVAQGDMEIVRQDGKELSVRFAAFFEIGADGLSREQRTYVDFTPLFT